MLSQNQAQLPVPQCEDLCENLRAQQLEDWHTYGFYNQDGTPVVPTEPLAAAIIADYKACDRPRNERNERAFQAYLAGRMSMVPTAERRHGASGYRDLQHFANADTDPGIAYELGRRDALNRALLAFRAVLEEYEAAFLKLLP